VLIFPAAVYTIFSKLCICNNVAEFRSNWRSLCLRKCMIEARVPDNDPVTVYIYACTRVKLAEANVNAPAPSISRTIVPDNKRNLRLSESPFKM
jgi:hypothetical protein